MTAGVCPVIAAGHLLPWTVDARTSRPASSGQLRDEGNCKEGERQARAALASADPADASAVADVTDELVEALICAGDIARPEARALAERVIQLRARPLGGEDRSITRSLRNLARLHDGLAEFGEARRVLERALEIEARTAGPASLETADLLDDLGLVLVHLYELDAAGRAIDRSLGIKQKILAPDDPRLVLTLERVVLLRLRQGEYRQARAQLERILAIRNQAPPSGRVTPDTLMLLSDLLWFEGKMVEAREAYRQTLSLAEATRGRDHPTLVEILRNLGGAEDQLGDPVVAKELRERALDLAERTLGAKHPDLVWTLNDLAISHMQLGDYSEARRLYERSRRMMTERYGGEGEPVATADYNLGWLDSLLGETESAEMRHRNALRIWQRVYGPHHAYVGRALDTLGEVLSGQGRDREARDLFERALAIRERTLAEDHFDLSWTLKNLSGVLARLGERSRARALADRALAAWDRSSAAGSPGYANVLHMWGDLRVALGQYGAARQQYERILEVQERALGERHPTVAGTRASLANVLLQLGETALALDHALRADADSQAHLRLTLRYMSERQALQYVATQPRPLDTLLCVATRDRVGASLDRLFDAVIRSRAAVLDEMALRRRALVENADGETRQLIDQLQSARRRLANLMVQGASAGPRYVTVLNEAREDSERAERLLAERHPSFKADVESARVGVDAIRAALPADAALVAFVQFAPCPAGDARLPAAPASARNVQANVAYAAFVLRSGSSNPTLVPLPSAEPIDRLVARWRQAMRFAPVRPGAARDAERRYRAVAAGLRKVIWDPLVDHLGASTRVFVVPDGAISLVSLSVLPTGEGPYLIEQGPTIHYLSAERDLILKERSVSSRRGLLAIGGPAFDAAPGLVAAALDDALTEWRRPAPLVAGNGGSQGQVFRGAPPACGGFSSVRFDDLPASRSEVEAIARLWQAPHESSAVDKDAGPAHTEPVLILTGAAAGEKAFKQFSAGHRIVHLATHGFFLDSQCPSVMSGVRAVGGLSIQSSRPERVAESPLVLSGLAFAGANRRVAAPRDADDGILTAEEIGALNLTGTEWAVLSACDTGVGDVRAGEGVLGLRRAFQIAGARTVIMSLWAVEDESAHQWMTALYEGRLRHGLDTAAAAREAALSVLRARQSQALSTHPFYWGGFVAAGDWR